MKVLESETFTTVLLSRRNLESLLQKLNGNPPDSACTLVGGTDAEGYVVKAEENEVHYSGREPGPVHEMTIIAIRKAAR